MPYSNHSRHWIGRSLAGLAGLFVLGAIIWLGYTVAREMQILRSARSDNAQWSLAQTEVEFLKFANAATGLQEAPKTIRRTFDVFYSRIQAIEDAQVYATLRADMAFQDDLTAARIFLDKAVTIIDLPDPEFVANAQTLRQLTTDARPVIRKLSNGGLTIFARNADEQRAAVAWTLTKLVATLAVFIGALGFAIVYLNKLNAQIARREREQIEIATRMNTVIETSLDGVIVSDSNGIVLEFNKAAEAIFGYTAEEARGQNLAQLNIPDHHLFAHYARLPKANATDSQKIALGGRVQLNARRKNGELFPVEFSTQAARSGNSEIYVAFLRDVSNTVAAEQELVTARDRALAGEKLKTDFLTTMSHEIRTPLNGLLGNLSLLKDTQRSNRQNRYIRNMETSGRMLMAHISDVLDVTRYDAGMLGLDIVPMNISVLIQDIIDSQSAMAETSATDLKWQWRGPSRDWVMSDPDRVQLVLMNIIGNAVKFTRNGGVTVSLEMIDPDDLLSPLRISIQDTGPGIASDLQKRIFDDFVTGNAAYDRDVGGTGLGLSIAKRFVKALNGSIAVHSVEGKGSTFDVILPMPAAEAPDLSVDHLASQTPTAISLSILIVEDNEINRTITREMLEAAGHLVVEAVNGQDGVEKAELQTFDLILMDISMPVMDGRTAARRIIAGSGRSAKTPIIALTAHASLEDQADFAKSGMVATLTKPLSREKLIKVLSTVGHGAPAVPNDTAVATSPDFTVLRQRFVTEIDTFVADLKSGDITLKSMRERAHHAAGSAATFQTESVAAPLRALSIAAKRADDAAIDRALVDVEKAWRAKRTTFLTQAAE